MLRALPFPIGNNTTTTKEFVQGLIKRLFLSVPRAPEQVNRERIKMQKRKLYI